MARAGVYALIPINLGRYPPYLYTGVWSSPKVWAPMLATLRADPALRAAYQFWVVLYPSGYALPLASLLRAPVAAQIRQRFDPHKTDLAFDEMVILGKSTGGQVGKNAGRTKRKCSLERYFYFTD